VTGSFSQDHFLFLVCSDLTITKLDVQQFHCFWGDLDHLEPGPDEKTTLFRLDWISSGIDIRYLGPKNNGENKFENSLELLGTDRNRLGPAPERM